MSLPAHHVCIFHEPLINLM